LDAAANNKIGRITTAGTISEHPVPTSTAYRSGIAAGSDGALWFAETSGNNIGRITTAGAISEYAVPTSNSEPFGITSGPDGALWFTDAGGGKTGAARANRLRHFATVACYDLLALHPRNRENSGCRNKPGKAMG
jgi:virginiamycin B lyase